MNDVWFYYKDLTASQLILSQKNEIILSFNLWPFYLIRSCKNTFDRRKKTLIQECLCMVIKIKLDIYLIISYFATYVTV